MITNNFTKRHVGPSNADIEKMLQTIGMKSIEELVSQTVPADIRLPKPLSIAAGMNEYEVQNHLAEIGSKNKVFRSFIGMGYYNTILPGVIQRNILENPSWYTSYTPYQAEISQGRLEALLNFQTMVSDLTAMPICNASLLDEGTAAAEAMIMAFNARKREKVKAGANSFFVSERLFPQSIEVIKTRALPLGIDIIIGDHKTFSFSENIYGAIVQYPDQFGCIHDYSQFANDAHNAGAMLIAACDILSLALLTPPGEWGADVVVGSTQRFGIPMGFGGPHAAFLAAKDEFIRHMPGRIIGISKDGQGNKAYRMTLQTREQHIKRERATSNICTAQALLAIMAGMYAAYHGPDGIKEIARHTNILSAVLNQEIIKLGYNQLNDAFFDTLHIQLPQGISSDSIKKLALDKEINLRYIDEQHIGISLDETTTLDEVNTLISIFAAAAGKPFSTFVCDPAVCVLMETFPAGMKRHSKYLQHPVFNKYQNETDMMRYMALLAGKDLSLDRTMIPLGSCTMKLNAATELFHLSWPSFSSIHPFVPEDQAAGYHFLINELDALLSEITGFAKISFQPNSGAAGEYAGLMVIRQYHISRGDDKRNVCLIPSSAHGTNPASAAMAGMQVVVVKCDDKGNIDVSDLAEKAKTHASDLSALMITYPSTHGVFEESVREIIQIVHANGGQVYMDGANMNAQVGITSPGYIGADVCHLNLHKTFAIPHGGGGPGVGPIGVAAHLVPFLPGHPVTRTGGEKAITALASAAFGSAYILPISYAYIKLLGGEGLKFATEMALLNANYLKVRLEKHYKILYTGKNNTVAHEMILDCNEFSRSVHIEVIDIAKRLMDYGFHAPTVAFPVHGTLMVEPTESEPLGELDRFVEAMIAIREEIKEIESGKMDATNNTIKNAPHTVGMVANSEWHFPYTREKAAFPVAMTAKYWPTVTRIDDAYGDRNIFCTCEPINN